MKILVWPGTGIIGTEVVESLRHLKNAEITIATDSLDFVNNLDTQKKIFIPNVNQEFTEWDFLLSQLMSDYDYIFPTNDFVIDLIVDNGIVDLQKFILPSLEIVKVCRSKKLTLELFKKVIPITNIIDESNIQFPVYFKPDKGYGSKNHLIIDNYESLQLAKKVIPDYLLTEVLEGKEYTIECFSSFENKLLYANPRVRKNIMFATSTNLESPNEIKRSKLIEIAQIINNEIKIEGPWFFQMKEDSKGTLKLLEIGIRVPGSAVWSRAKGVNLPVLAIYNKQKIRLSIIENKINLKVQRNLSSKIFFEHQFEYIYLDFDDTIYVEGRITEEAYLFLSKCKFNQIKVILISKYLFGNLNQKLLELKINHFFYDVIHIKIDDNKYKYIKYYNSIYIDDSFYERKEVSKFVGINVFGPEIMSLI